MLTWPSKRLSTKTLSVYDNTTVAVFLYSSTVCSDSKFRMYKNSKNACRLIIAQPGLFNPTFQSEELVFYIFTCVLSYIQPLEQHPLPLEQGEKFTYLVDLKRDLQTFMEDSSFYIKPDEKKHDIDRYTDKYKMLAHPTTEQDLLCKFD